jgi:hypothetical protein
LLAAHRRAKAQAGELRLAMPPGLLRVFELTGIDHVIPNFPSLEQAVALRPGREQNGLVAPLGAIGIEGQAR